VNGATATATPQQRAACQCMEPHWRQDHARQFQIAASRLIKRDWETTAMSAWS